MIPPKVTFKHGKSGTNMQSWTPKEVKGKPAYGCRAVYWATVVKDNGWVQTSDWEWKVSHTGFNQGTHEEHDETWGDLDNKKKNGGYIYDADVANFTMKYEATAEFVKDSDVEEFTWRRNILGVNKATGEAFEDTTALVTEVEDDVCEQCEKYEDIIDELELRNELLEAEMAKLKEEHANCSNTPTNALGLYKILAQSLWAIPKVIKDSTVLGILNAIGVALPILIPLAIWIF